MSLQLLEQIPQFTCHRPRAPRPDGPSIQGNDRYNLSCASGQKTLIRNINIVPDESTFDHRVSRVLRQANHSIAGDAFEDTGVSRRSSNLTIT